MFAWVKLETLKRRSTPATISAVLSTKSLEKAKSRAPPVFICWTRLRTSSRASRVDHWLVAIDSNRSEYESVVPPLLTRTNMSRTLSVSCDSSR